jgi:hypothetical protein
MPTGKRESTMDAGTRIVVGGPRQVTTRVLAEGVGDGPQVGLDAPVLIVLRDEPALGGELPGERGTERDLLGITGDVLRLCAVAPPR